jgi:hypothetical protein
VGLLRYLRGDDLLEDRSTQPTGEQRSLPPAENQLPLLGAYTASNITPTAALAIGDVWAAVRVLADAASSLRFTSIEPRPTVGGSVSGPAGFPTSSAGRARAPPKPT